MLQLVNVKKDYVTAGNTVHALRGVSLRFRKNEFVSILGSSGCGKTTMLNVIGGLDHYTSGDLIINGVSTKDYKDRDWDVYRNHRIGFVFQSYNLIPHQTVLANVELALTIAGVGKAERRKRAEEALVKVGLKKEMRKRPNQLSGGQMQRVAIARALVNDPEILLADEPTGALDSVTSVQIMELIREIANDRLVIMVTHNGELAEEYSTRIVRLQDGLVISDTNPYTCEEAGEEKTARAKLCQTEKGKRIAVIECPHCNKVLKHEKAGKSKCTCPFCGNTFKAVGLTAKERKGKKERSAMSFGTSLGLSAKNLLTKKGRTFITSFAGSIGIISVCLVLALSNGFNNYILRTQEDMLSGSPLQITETTVNVDAIMSGMTSASDMPDLDKIGDRVYVNSFLTNIAQGMTVNNNLSDKYLSHIESMDKSWYEAIVYDTGVNLSNNLYTEVEIEENGNTVKQVKSLSELKAYYTLKLTQQEEKYASLAYLVDYLGSIYGKLPGTTDVTSEDFGDYVLSQYEIIGEGHFPKNANEAVLVVGSNNDMTDLTLAQLGFIGEKDFLALFPQEGEKVESSDKYETMIDFSEIVGKKFVLNYNDAVYTANENPTEYLYSYKGTRAELGNDSKAGETVTITGVLRLKEQFNYGCLGSGLYLTEQLYAEYTAKNMQSALVNTLREQTEKAQAFGVLTTAISELKQGTPEYMAKLQEIMTFIRENMNAFKPASDNLKEYYMSGSGAETSGMEGFYFLYGDTALRAVGGKDKVNAISIYTSNFEAKESVLAHLDKWNNTHESDEQVKYTDTVGLMLSMVQSILDVITYVLVAFTAISLVVSSVMIGIITYVSVVERTKEIGVLRALGARKKDVRNLFNAETFIIGLSAGAIGVGVTYLLCLLVNAILAPLTGIAQLAVLPPESAILMVVISVILTLISGLIPARAAAKKDPVIALRTE